MPNDADFKEKPKIGPVAKLEFLRAMRPDRRLSSLQWAVAETLLDSLNRHSGIAWPGYRYLAEQTGATERGIKKSVDALLANGWFICIKKGGGSGKSNHYIPNWKKVNASSPLEKNETVNASTETENASTRNGERQCPKTVNACSTEPVDKSINEPIEETYGISVIEDDVAEALNLYNRFAAEHNLVETTFLLEIQKKKLRRCLQACDGIEGWNYALKKVAASPFLLGVHSDFRANLDFLLKPEMFKKVMEGSYDVSKNKEKSNRTTRDKKAAGFEALEKIEC